MVASLKFYTDSKRDTLAVADLSNAQVIVYEDGNGNKYTLDASSIAGLTKIDDIKPSNLKDVSFKYHPKGGSETTTTGLGSIIGALLATQSAQNGKTILTEEIVKQSVVDVLVSALATVGTDDTKKVYTKTDADTAFAKVDGANLQIPAFVTKLATGAGADGVYTKTDTDTAFAKVDGANLQIPAFVTKLATGAGADGVYTKTDTDTAFAKVDGANLQIPAFVTKLATGAGADGVYTKATADTAFVKIDGSNATEAGINSMLGKLTGTNRVVKADGTNADDLIPQLAAPTSDDVANAGDIGFQEAGRVFEIPSDPNAPLNLNFV